MSQIRGIYAAGVSILDDNLSLNVDRTIKHSESLIEQGCHGVAIFGSTGQAQLISISEKINLLNKLSLSRYKKNFLIGTGLIITCSTSLLSSFNNAHIMIISQ